MTTYITMLRGINVSGKNIIKMNALKELYAKQGFQEVTTYLQSGNVIFRADKTEPKKLAQHISKQIEMVFGLDVPVVALTIDKLKRVIAKNPLAKDSTLNPDFLHVTFLSSAPDQTDHSLIESKKLPGEVVAFSDAAIYLYCPSGYGKTRLNNNFLESKLHVQATTRNWKTTQALLQVALEKAD